MGDYSSNQFGDLMVRASSCVFIKCSLLSKLRWIKLCTSLLYLNLILI